VIWSWSLVGEDGAPCDDFRMDERGRFAEDHTAATPIALILAQRLGAWWAHPGHGSRVHELMRGTPSPDMEAAVRVAAGEALAQLERQGRIRDVRVTARVSGNRAHVQATVYDVGRGAPVTVAMEVPA